MGKEGLIRIIHVLNKHKDGKMEFNFYVQEKGKKQLEGKGSQGGQRNRTPMILHSDDCPPQLSASYKWQTRMCNRPTANVLNISSDFFHTCRPTADLRLLGLALGQHGVENEAHAPVL